MSTGTKNCQFSKKRHSVRLTTLQIIALSKAVQVACWRGAYGAHKGFGKTRRQHAVRAEALLLRAIS